MLRSEQEILRAVLPEKVKQRAISLAREFDVLNRTASENCVVANHCRPYDFEAWVAIKIATLEFSIAERALKTPSP